MTLAEKLIQLRKKQMLSRREVAEQTGIRLSKYYSYECDNYNNNYSAYAPDTTAIADFRKLAELLECDLEYLLPGLPNTDVVWDTSDHNLEDLARLESMLDDTLEPPTAGVDTQPADSPQVSTLASWEQSLLENRDTLSQVFPVLTDEQPDTQPQPQLDTQTDAPPSEAAPKAERKAKSKPDTQPKPDTQTDAPSSEAAPKAEHKAKSKPDTQPQPKPDAQPQVKPDVPSKSASTAAPAAKQLRLPNTLELQFRGRTVHIGDLLRTVQEQAKGNTLSLYIKPDDAKVYYVTDLESGSISF